MSFFLFLSVLSMAQVADKAENISPLLVGEKMPADSVQNADGAMMSLAAVFAKKPTLLVVFRGGWCPYCNVQLAGLGEAEEEILKLGYQIVALSPDDYKEIPAIETKDKIKYQLYSDKDAKVITNMGIAFNTAKRGILPVPTVMVINQSGEILFEHINPNYKVRMESDYVLTILTALKSKI
ncbi:MAG: peroxiredoxin-like family protein [Saprospiraceae bacterium]